MADGLEMIAVDTAPGRMISDPEAADEAVIELLTGRGKLDDAGVQRVRRVQTDGGEPLHSLLVKLGLVSELDMAEALAQVLGLPLAQQPDFPDQPLLDGVLSYKFQKDSRLLPLAETADEIVLAMADPLDSFSAGAVAVATGRAVRRQVATPAEIEQAQERLFGKSGSVLSDIVDTMHDGAEDGGDAERLRDMASEAPVIRFVNQLIGRAVEARASDIHIEPFESKLRVRYRVDGLLREVETPPGRLTAAIISRVKIMSKLNIAERRLPQDGRIKLAIRGKEVDFRVSTVPTMHGESVVMRILDRGGAVFEFSALGIDEGVLQPYLQMLERPNGILLVTGPTGSGKTTTLYAAMEKIDRASRNVMTIEDPVEYHLEGIAQVQVNVKRGVTFAAGLRSLLRQDPDVILVGEVRDAETAQLAVQASLTGHLVLATLHTNDAPSAISRLQDIGIEPYLIASSLLAVLAQRLTRRTCAVCSGKGQAPLANAPSIIARCERCFGSGFSGRLAIYEIMPVTDDIRQQTMVTADAVALRALAVKQGMKTMWDDGHEKVARGLTTETELRRVLA